MAPYGVYDIAANGRQRGWVNGGVDGDTAVFAVKHPRWWHRLGKFRYPKAKALTVTADYGGSNGARMRLWKRELQRFANETGLSVTVASSRRRQRRGGCREARVEGEHASEADPGGKSPQAGQKKQPDDAVVASAIVALPKLEQANAEDCIASIEASAAREPAAPSTKSERAEVDCAAPMGRGATAIMERLAASLGLLNEVTSRFAPALDIPKGGVLLALPALLGWVGYFGFCETPEVLIALA